MIPDTERLVPGERLAWPIEDRTIPVTVVCVIEGGVWPTGLVTIAPDRPDAVPWTSQRHTLARVKRLATRIPA